MLDAATVPTPAHLDPAAPSSEVAAARAEQPVTYTAVLPVPRRVVAFVADLHEKHFAALHTRPGRRALSA